MMAFFEFDQNNSGGSFDVNDRLGIGPRVWIEASDIADAVDRAVHIGIYFDGVDAGRDCDCCGDRWHKPWADDGKKTVEINKWSFGGHDTVYVHRLDGTIERVTKPDNI